MSTNYDPIAEQYRLCKYQPWRVYIEGNTLMQTIGNNKDLDILDIACGEGFYTRMLKQRGGRRVTGVDLSAHMVDLARRQEEMLEQGIEYVAGDACKLPATADYDLATAAYFLNYAHTRDELQSMCDSIAGVLKPGGRFVTVNSNPACDFSKAPSYRKYGFDAQAAGEWKEGCPIRWTFYLEQGPFDIENYWLDTALHEDALRSAGFRDVRWQQPRVSSEGLREKGRDYWAEFIDTPPITFLECIR
ncbi:MAG TPA: class I SAM-dependent methyltransferase [Caulifigura sp.]|jgi:ubiquinone/menaquinone biosynthesis C-methylase UbiE|nr:class I SAM-dependent methyltransferase [Caulifigura sp.]